MSNQSKTITVRSHFNDKTMTLDEFTETWDSHTKELLKLSYMPEFSKELEKFRAIVKAECEAEFNRIYKEEKCI